MTVTEAFITDSAGDIWVLPSGGGPMVRTGGSAALAASSVKVITVSPYGIVNGGATTANNGAQYGPDTGGTVTCGIQEAINAAVTSALAGASQDILLLPGKFILSTFTNSTYRSVLTVDCGYNIGAGPPISITIRGSAPVSGCLNGTTFANSYLLNGTVLDASLLDVLSLGLYKQGRLIFVPPYGTSGIAWPMSATQVSISNLTIILPTYTSYGTGANYTIGSGYGSMSLFVSGNTATANNNHFLFVSGIDAWGATSCQADNVTVVSAIAAYNTTGNGHAGGGGVLPLGPAAGIVFPAAANEGNVMGRRISTYDLPIGVQNSCHLSCDNFYAQNPRVAIYTREGGHGAIYNRINVQEGGAIVQHALLPQLTNSVSGAGLWDPVGDLYVPIGKTFPTSAAPTSLIISQASIENCVNFLTDDSSNPLTCVANVEVSTAGFANNKWGTGKNLVVNFVDQTAIALTALAGTTAGTVTYSQSGSTPWDKRFVAYLNGYENTTGTAQTITFVNAYNNAPAIVKDSTSGASVSTTTLTLPASMGSPVTGYIILAGY